MGKIRSSQGMSEAGSPTYTFAILSFLASQGRSPGVSLLN